MGARFRIRKVAPATLHPVETLVFGREPYGIWDTHEHAFVNKYGEPDPEYWASREVASMRTRDLNHRHQHN